MGSLIYVFFIIIGLVLLILSIRAYKQGHIIMVSHGGKKADILDIMACFIYQNICVRIILKYLKGSFMEYLFQSPQVKKDLCAISPESRPKILESQYYVNKIRKFLIIIMAGDILALCVCIGNSGNDEIHDGKYIDRNTYGRGQKQIVLQVETKDGEFEDEIQFKVEETALEEEQLESLYNRAVLQLESVIWGDGNFAKETRESLNLPVALEGYPFELEWESSNYFLMNHRGELQEEDIDVNGESIELICHFSYREWKRDFVMPVHILPKLKTDEQIWKEQIIETLAVADKEQAGNATYILPQEIAKKDVIWREIKEDYSFIMFAIIILAACSIYVLQDHDLHKKTEERDKSMMAEYPVLINRLTLYLGAGMTIKGAWNKIAGDYKKSKEKSGERNYAYEEMLFSCYEMQCGVSEGNAYERFGLRCSLVPYTRLVGLLCQSMKKGNAALLGDLQKEAEDAQELRRSLARKKGEEAGTKLLAPMIMMLAIVMVLVMVPAFLSFTI